MTDGRDKTGFWSVVIGVPVLLSVLRLWVEAGGELQTTLLLVAHVDPINLIAALIATGSWLASAMFVAALAAGGVLNASGPAGERSWLARWAGQAPPWVKFASFTIAAVTWQLIYLPLLLVAACATFQLTVWSGRAATLPVRRRLATYLLVLMLQAAYFVLIGQTLAAAWRLTDIGMRAMAVGLLAAPPILALFVAGPLSPGAVRTFAVAAQLVGFALLVWAVIPLVAAPVLPLTVTAVGAEDAELPTDYIRGHVVTSDDVYTVVMQEDGRVRYLPNKTIKGQELCPTSDEIPRYGLRFIFPGVEPVFLEQSMLSGLGQAKRGTISQSPACRARPSSG
jgi:hypothetical protein